MARYLLAMTLMAALVALVSSQGFVALDIDVDDAVLDPFEHAPAISLFRFFSFILKAFSNKFETKNCALIALPSRAVALEPLGDERLESFSVFRILIMILFPD